MRCLYHSLCKDSTPMGELKQASYATFYKPWNGDAVEIGPGRTAICSYPCNENA